MCARTGKCALTCLLFAAGCNRPAIAQTTDQEFRPELGVYLQLTDALRIEFVNTLNGDESTEEWRGNFNVYVETALKPVFRRRFRKHPNVYRERYLTFRAGYRYRTNLTSGDPVSENRAIFELTSRYPLPWVVISDRNRGDFRWIRGEPFSTRYANRLRIERDITSDWFECTPYVQDEMFYDTRSGQWVAPNRYGAGVQFPVGEHVVVEPFYWRALNHAASPEHTNIYGLTLSLYF